MLFGVLSTISSHGCKEVICNFIFTRFFVYFVLELVQTFDIAVIEAIVLGLAFEGWTKPRLANDQPRLLAFSWNLCLCLKGLSVLFNSSLCRPCFMQLTQLLVQVQELLFIQQLE